MGSNCLFERVFQQNEGIGDLWQQIRRLVGRKVIMVIKCLEAGTS